MRQPRVLRAAAPLASTSLLENLLSSSWRRTGRIRSGSLLPGRYAHRPAV